MKKSLILLMVPIAVIVLAQLQSSPIVVKEATIATGVAIVTADQAVRRLSCNAPRACQPAYPLKTGKYVMVQLAKNHVMYDCQIVDIYLDGSNPASAQKIGEYCLSRE